MRKAFDICPENIRALERLAEVHVLTGLKEEAAKVLLEVSGHYQRAGQLQDADRCRNRAAQLSRFRDWRAMPRPPRPGLHG